MVGCHFLRSLWELLVAWYCSATDVIDRLSEQGVRLRLDDRPEAISSVLREAKNRVKFYCMPLYDEDDLQADADADGFVNDLATNLAVCYLCRRRGNVQPASVKEMCAETMADLEDIRRDMKQLPDVPQRHKSSPAFSNVTVDSWYTYKQVRVEMTISEDTSPVGYVQSVDWRSVGWVEY